MQVLRIALYLWVAGLVMDKANPVGAGLNILVGVLILGALFVIFEMLILGNAVRCRNRAAETRKKVLALRRP